MSLSSYEEIEGSPTFSGAKDAITATRTLKIPWDDIDSVMLACFPDPYPGLLSIPHYFPGKSWLWLKSYEITPFDPNNPGVPDAYGVSTFPDAGARLTLHYSSDHEEEKKEDEGSYIGTYSFQSGGEMQQLPNTSMYWENGDKNKPITEEDVRGGIVVPTIEHSFGLEQVVKVPWSSLREKLGHVNSSGSRLPFPPYKSHPAGTVLFLSASGSRKLTARRGTEIWKIDYKFSERALKANIYKAAGKSMGWVTWNHFYQRSNPPMWAKILSVDTDETPFAETTFNDLFYISATTT